MSTQMCNSAEWGPSSMHCNRVNRLLHVKANLSSKLNPRSNPRRINANWGSISNLNCRVGSVVQQIYQAYKEAEFRGISIARFLCIDLRSRKTQSIKFRNADVCVSFVRRDSNTAMRVADFLLPWLLVALIRGG